ncbi:MAG: ribonuclease HI family protein [Candidatus Daviesbacteria bacterium]|nr:ribonuclease HI family protein [Candidatus Daviesbacteria bacterium]
MKYIIYTDGGSRGNPGPAAAAFIVKSEGGEVLAEKGAFLGVATNNEAEYAAVIKALELMVLDYKDLKSAEIEVRADSKLVVEQLSGNWKIKNERIRVLCNQVKQLESNLGKIEYKYIPRDLNHEADLIVNITLDNQKVF